MFLLRFIEPKTAGTLNAYESGRSTHVTFRYDSDEACVCPGVFRICKVVTTNNYGPDSKHALGNA